jgi:hypothetical protein
MSNYANSSEGHKGLPSLNVVVHNCGLMIDVLQGQLTTMKLYDYYSKKKVQISGKTGKRYVVET